MQDPDEGTCVMCGRLFGFGFVIERTRAPRAYVLAGRGGDRVSALRPHVGRGRPLKQWAVAA